MMRIASVGTGGALILFEDGKDAVSSIDVFSGGTHVTRQELTRFLPSNTPFINLIHIADLSRAASMVQPMSGQSESIGWGARVSDDWAVVNEDTPFIYRGNIGDFRISKFDLTLAFGLEGWKPIPGRLYHLSVDMAQHRCGVGLSFEWLDRRGDTLRRDEAWRESGPMGGTMVANYEPLRVSGHCPIAATALRIVILHGPPTENPDAYLFYRAAKLTEGDPEDRPVIDMPGLKSSSSSLSFAILPLGDIVDAYGDDLAISNGTHTVELSDLESVHPIKKRSAITVLNGAYLDIFLPDGRVTDGELVYVTLDGVLLGFYALNKSSEGGRCQIRMPVSLLDGGDHWVEVRGGELGETLHAASHSFPSFVTPAEVLKEHTSRIDDPGIMPFAAARYQALLGSIARLSEAKAINPNYLAQITACHDYVVKGPQKFQTRFDPRTLPVVKNPRFSIVIPVHNKFYFTYFCISSILYTLAGMSYEIILVDDGSSDETLNASTIIENVKVVRHDVPEGFVGACNAGAAAAQGEFILFLNNDIEVIGRWLDELHAPFLMFDGVGLTGAKLVYPDGRLQEAGGIVWKNGRPWNYGREDNPAEPAYSYTRQADYLSGAALMIPRKIWSEVGGFSREFAPAYYEDTDLCFKVRDAGYKTVLAAKSVIVHYEGVSNGTNTSGSGLKRFQEINRPKFENKWRKAYRHSSPEGVEPDLEKDRGQIGRALVLDYQAPRFDKDAGSFAISQEIRVLQALGYKVTLVPLNFAYLGIYTEAFERAGVEHLHAPFYSSVHEVLERRGAEFDLVYIHRYTTAKGIIPKVREHAPNAKILLNCADLHFLRELRAARLASSEEKFEGALVTRRDEIEVMRAVDCVLTYSDTELAVIESYLGLSANVRRLPWIVASGAALPLEQRDGIVFLGSFDHPPNRDAVEYFLENCWPQIRERDQSVKFYIVGSGFERFELKEPDSRVEIVGWVEDASAFLSKCRVMVAPLRTGAGVKGKVFDALVNGTPVALSKVAAEGIATGESCARIATEDADWVEAVVSLLGSDSEWRRVSEQGMAFIQQNYSFANAVDVFAGILDSVGAHHVSPKDSLAGEAFYPVVSMRDLHLLLRPGS